MLKKIIVTGKNNVDKLEKKEKSTRLVAEKWTNKTDLINENNENQTKMLNQLFLNQSFNGDKYVKKEINKKINGYKNQDIKKNIFNKKEIITYDETLEKLVISKLKCYYCKTKCLLMFNNVREERQWTLDRINNNVGHSKDNTVICCLKCNLKKGTMNDEKFKFTKQLKIIKKF